MKFNAGLDGCLNELLPLTYLFFIVPFSARVWAVVDIELVVYELNNWLNLHNSK